LQDKHTINLRIQEVREMIVKGKLLKAQLLNHNKCLQGSTDLSQSPQQMQQMHSQMYRKYHGPYAHHSTMQSESVECLLIQGN
jgi:hypothetical protein